MVAKLLLAFILSNLGLSAWADHLATPLTSRARERGTEGNGGNIGG